MSFQCPDCKRVSHNPNDERERYCGACHKFFGSDERYFECHSCINIVSMDRASIRGLCPTCRKLDEETEMSTLERLRELEAEYNNEAGGISSAEIREVMEALPKLLALVEAFDNWNEKRQEHITIASRAWDQLEASRRALES